MTPEALAEAPWSLSQYDVIILTECTHSEIILIDNYCRKHSPNTKIIVADAVGVFTRVINDFGDKFEVLDKNGEELIDFLETKLEQIEQSLAQSTSEYESLQ